MKYFYTWLFLVAILVALHYINPSYWSYDVFDAAYFSGFGILLGGELNHV